MSVALLFFPLPVWKETSARKQAPVLTIISGRPLGLLGLVGFWSICEKEEVIRRTVKDAAAPASICHINKILTASRR